MLTTTALVLRNTVIRENFVALRDAHGRAQRFLPMRGHGEEPVAAS